MAGFIRRPNMNGVAPSHGYPPSASFPPLCVIPAPSASFPPSRVIPVKTGIQETRGSRDQNTLDSHVRGNDARDRDGRTNAVEMNTEREWSTMSAFP